jgi:hypothetical protein
MDADEICRAPALPEECGDEGERETGSDWFVWKPTIGPASPLRPGQRISKDVQRGLSLGLPSLAAQLCWRVWKHEG